MNKCPNYNTDNAEYRVTCVNCGEPIGEVKRCAKCSATVNIKAERCPMCGESLIEVNEDGQVSYKIPKSKPSKAGVRVFLAK